MENFHNQGTNNLNEEEIDLGIIFRILLRSKNLIFRTTLFVGFLMIIFSYLIRPTWRGSFQMVTKDDSGSSILNSLSDTGAGSLLQTLTGGNPIGSKDKTEELIIKSPSVLEDVFLFHKNYIQKKSKSNSKSNLTFKKWLNSLDIKFERGSDILNVSFKHSDKKHILDILNLTVKEYEKYSLQDRIEQLQRLDNYLTNQKELRKENSSRSSKEFNKFSIKHGLGNIDGFMELGVNSQSKPDLEGFRSEGISGDIFDDLIENYSFDYKEKGENAGQRYSKQISLLEDYEAQYNDLQSKLKPNSQIIINLKNKIDNLKSLLKRPNEILVKYRELASSAKREERIFFDVENKLSMVKMEIARGEVPWKTISPPIIDPTSVAPRKKLIVFIGVSIWFIFISIFIIFREKRLGVIYELNVLKNKIKINHKYNLCGTDPKVDIKLINSFLKNDMSLLNLDDIDKTKIRIIKNFNLNQNYLKQIEKYSGYQLVSFEDELVIEKLSYLIFIVNKNLSNKDIIEINNYIQIYKDKIYGWFYITPE